MTRSLAVSACLVVAAVIARSASAAIVVTEIHYNPNGPENQNQEWIEIFNTGDAEQDLSGWDWGDSQDQQFTGNFPAGTTLAPGKAAILVAQSASTFQQIWGGGVQVIQADTGISLGNSATPTNETVVIRDAADTIIDEVNYETALDGWPGNNNQASIYLKPGSIDQLANDIGANWDLSSVGVEGGFQALALNPDITNATLTDVASPGVVVIDASTPEPGSLAGLGLTAIVTLATRRRRLRA